MIRGSAVVCVMGAIFTTSACGGDDTDKEDVAAVVNAYSRAIMAGGFERACDQLSPRAQDDVVASITSGVRRDLRRARFPFPLPDSCTTTLQTFQRLGSIDKSLTAVTDLRRAQREPTPPLTSPDRITVEGSKASGTVSGGSRHFRLVQETDRWRISRAPIEGVR